MWVIFAVTAVTLFVADIRISSGRAHEISRREALTLCAFWVLIATLFGFLTGYVLGYERMLEFFTAYVIEYSLSMDNIFVFIMIFAYFNVPKKYQPKILTWGILGAVTMRLVLIFAGVGLITAFSWIIYVFGAVLIFTAVKMFLQKDGGDIELVDIVGGVVKVRLKGACGTCPMSMMTLKMGVEKTLKEAIPEVTEVVSV